MEFHSFREQTDKERKRYAATLFFLQERDDNGGKKSHFMFLEMASWSRDSCMR